MAIVRFDPPDKDGADYSQEASAAIGSAATLNPVGAALAGISAAIKYVTNKPSTEVAHGYHTVPIEVDTTTGKVSYIAQDRLDRTGDGHGSKKDRLVQVTRAAKAAPILEKIYRTGRMPDLKTIPTGYRAIAEEVLKLSTTDPADPFADIDTSRRYVQPADEQPAPEAPPIEDYDMGGFIPPGGMAGFAQMTGASKLALSRLGRGTRKRRTKKRKAGKKKRKSAKRRSGKKRLVKGSAAAKRYMASIRRKRK